ncbi:MAG: hypothetical protein WBR15_10455 [Gammaproteobacteria bacterium]
MPQYTFVGTVLPDTARINSPVVHVHMDPVPDCPEINCDVQIFDNRLIAAVIANSELTNTGFATLRNICEDIAASICDSASLLEGAWTAPIIDTCLGADGRIMRRFNAISAPELKEYLARSGVTMPRIEAVYKHQDGFYLRHTITDLVSGLQRPQFMRTLYYRALESLRNSIGEHLSIPANESADRWDAFHSLMGTNRHDLQILERHDERHGNYGSLQPLSSAEKAQIFQLIARVLANYLSWFETQKLTA